MSGHSRCAPQRPPLHGSGAAVAGLTQDPRGLTSGSNGDLSYGGTRGYQNSYLVDGGDNNNSFYAQARGRYRTPYQFSNEVIKEFRVSSNGYSVELGRAGGAVLNVVTTSGSNRWRGSGFFYVRDRTFDAQSADVSSQPDKQQASLEGPSAGRSLRIAFSCIWGMTSTN
jgi:hypothetical protein